jgi:hypothetical protein
MFFHSMQAEMSTTWGHMMGLHRMPENSVLHPLGTKQYLRIRAVDAMFRTLQEWG